MAITTLGAVLIGGGLLGSAALSSNAAKKAGGQVAASTDRAAELQNQQFQQLMQMQMPAYNRGETAASVYMQALGIGGSPSFSSPAPGGAVQPQAPRQDQTQIRPLPSQSQRPMTGRMPQPDSNYDAGPIARPMTNPGAAPSTTTTQPVGRPVPVPSGSTAAPAPAAQNPQLDIPAQVMATPGYQAQLDQGLKAIDRAAPLIGGMYSGRRMKALNDYGQNTFGSYYQNWMDRVGGVAGQGQQAGQNVGQAGMQYATNAGNLMTQGANARANATMNSANAWSGAIGTGVGLYAGGNGWM